MKYTPIEYTPSAKISATSLIAETVVVIIISILFLWTDTRYTHWNKYVIKLLLWNYVNIGGELLLELHNTIR